MQGRTHTRLLSEASRRKPSGLCKIERRAGNTALSLETVLNTEAYHSEGPSLIGRKSLKGWISDKADPAESGDSGKSLSGIQEGSRLGHLISFKPWTRLITYQVRSVSSSRMPGLEQSHADPTPPGSRFVSCDALATKSVHAAR